MKKLFLIVISIFFMACSSIEKETNNLVLKEKPFKYNQGFNTEFKDAKEVYLNIYLDGEYSKKRMAKMRDGKWFTNMMLSPGKYYYEYIVDGDLKLANKFIHSDFNGKEMSYVVVKKEIKDKKYNSNIFHGKVNKIEFYSESLGGNGKFNIYLPPKYNQKEKYPVMYLTHGYGMSEEQWIDGGIYNYMDNYIAAGLIKPFIVVMPYIEIKSDGGGKYLEELASSKISNFIMDDLINYVESNYSVYKEREQRIISGQSMGGTLTLIYSFENQDKYGKAISLMARVPENFDVKFGEIIDMYGISFELSIYSGQEDYLYEGNKDLVKFLEEKKVEFKFVSSKGGHGWDFLDNILRDVLMESSDYFYN